MLYDIIQITEGAEIRNASVAVGNQFPTDANLGELFFYDPAFGGGGGGGYGLESVTGLYVYRDGTWNKIRSGNESASSNIEYIIKKADATVPYAQAIENLNTGILQYSGNNGNIESGPVDLGDITHVTGDLSPYNFPGLTGDVTTTPETFITALSNSGVVADTGYTKFEVDSKGRVVSASKPTKAIDYYLDNVVTIDNVTPQSIISPLIGNYASFQSPTNAKELVTKQYVDNLISGLDAKAAVKVATVTNISLTGLFAIDGITINNGDRILVKDQINAEENGVYVADAASWQRANDALSLSTSSYFFVAEGSTNGDSGWLLTTDGVINVGVTPLTFVQFTGTGQISAGSGLSKTGNIINVGGTTNRITVNADSIDIASTYEGQPSITTLGTITSATWNAGKIDALYGGTGFSNYTVGNLLYADTTSTLAKLAPNNTPTPKFLAQTNTGIPSWNGLTDEDIPNTLVSKSLVGSSTWNGSTIEINYGGTGLTSTGSANTVLSSTGTVNEYRSFGSDNGVSFNYSSGLIKINTPQDLRTTDSPTFNSITNTSLQADMGIVTDSSKQLVSAQASTNQINWLSGILRPVRTLPALANDFIEIGSFDISTIKIQSLVIDLIYDTGVASIAKRYEIITRNNHTAGAWQTVEPIASTGSNGGNDFELNINVNSSTSKLRIRKTQGTDSGDVRVFIMQHGSGNAFSTSSITGTDNSVLSIFDVRNITLTSGVAGVLTPTNGGTGLSSYSIGDLIFANSINTLSTIPAASMGYVLLSGTTPGWGKVNLSMHVNNVLSAENGGTGQSGYMIGDLLYANTSSTISKLSDVAVGNVLLSGGVNDAPYYGKVDLSQHIAGITPLANGGTNSNLTANAGAIVYSTSSEFNLSSVGTVGQIFQSNGTAAPTWISPSSLTVGNSTNFNSLATSDFMRSNIQAYWAASSLGQQFTIQVEAGANGSSTSSSLSTLRIYQPTFNTDAFMVFEDFSDNRFNFGIDGSANDLFVGGGTMGSVKNRIYHAGNTTGAVTSILSSNLTANKVLVADGSGKVGVATTSTTELNQLVGVTGTVPCVNPSTPRNGDIQTDTANGIIRVYLNGAWRQVFPAVYS